MNPGRNENVWRIREIFEQCFYVTSYFYAIAYNWLRNPSHVFCTCNPIAFIIRNILYEITIYWPLNTYGSATCNSQKTRPHEWYFGSWTCGTQLSYIYVDFAILMFLRFYLSLNNISRVSLSFRAIWIASWNCDALPLLGIPSRIFVLFS